MEIDIQIDKLTDCLIDRVSGTIMDTCYQAHLEAITSQECLNWNFDWSIPPKNGYTIYELFLKNNPTVQGRIAFKADQGFVDIDIVESAPHNLGQHGKYIGVGGHLFAIACQYSMNKGFDGVVAFTAKSNLVEYYKRELNAVEIMPRRMVIFENAAQLLLNKYLRK